MDKKKWQVLIRGIADKKDRQIVSTFWEKVVLPFVKDIDRFVEDIAGEKGPLPKLQRVRFGGLIDDVCKQAEELVEGASDERIKKEARKLFRETRPEYFYASEIVKKGFLKVRGYPGDFEMMNFVYDQPICSESRIGKYFDDYFVNNAYAQAVRGRKDKMVAMLRSIVVGHTGRHLKIVNLPCGPARDVREFVTSKALERDIHVKIVCIDQDQEALDFGKESLADCPKNVSVVFAKGNILQFVRKMDEFVGAIGKFDVVYSIGIADYLPDRLLQNMILFSWKLLSRGGKLIYAFKIKDRDPFAPLPPKWFCDWEFVPRDLEESKRIILRSGIDGFVMDKEEWEKSGRIVFLSARKKG